MISHKWFGIGGTWADRKGRYGRHFALCQECRELKNDPEDHELINQLGPEYYKSLVETAA